MEWDHNAEEERNGVRYSWGCWPSSRLEAQKCVVPIGMLYSPLKRIERPAGMSADPMQYDPVRCTNCGSVLNPWCQVDFQSKVWSCPFCLNRNPFSPHYADNISEQNLPAELIPQYTTIEYELQPAPGRQATPPVFLFVMDTAVDKDELESLRDSLQQSINLIPDDALVGFITFGTMVQVREKRRGGKRGGEGREEGSEAKTGARRGMDWGEEWNEAKSGGAAALCCALLCPWAEPPLFFCLLTPSPPPRTPKGLGARLHGLPQELRLSRDQGHS